MTSLRRAFLVIVLLVSTITGASALAQAAADGSAQPAAKGGKAQKDEKPDKPEKEKKPKKDKDDEGDGGGGTTIDNQPGTCVSGLLATDPEGDDTWAGQTDTGLERGSGDLLAISTDLVLGSDQETASFFVDVRDLGDQESDGTALDLILDLLVDGETFTVRAERGALASATFGGSSDGVTATFGTDEAPNRITITGPSAGLVDAGVLSLPTAEARYSSPALLSPLADTASGTCYIGVQPESPTGDDASSLDTTVVVVDTGIHASHEEYDFDETVNGPNGQLVAWWDFSDQNTSGEVPDDWYEGHAPYDPDMDSAHGTGTSSMAVGRNVSPGKTPSACPGCKLGFAKVYDEEADSLNGSVADAIYWGVDVVGADVISISIGALIPIPEILVDVHEAAGYARSQGTLVVFANGNGWGNAGVPGQPGGFNPYGNSTNVLSVGADELDSFLVTTDPEVVADFTVVTGNNDGGYHQISGTSFSAPFVAGVAARLIGEGRACGAADLSPDFIEQLIKDTAFDRPEVPPSFEGYGDVTLDTFAVALGVLCDRAERPTPDELSAFYVENVSGTERDLWTNKLDPGESLGTPLIPTGFNATDAGVIGASTNNGTKDVEVYRVTVPAGSTLAVTATGLGDLVDVNDFDMAAFPASADFTYNTADALDTSGNGGAVSESIVWTNTGAAGVTVDVVVYGWLVVEDQPFTISGVAGAPAYDGYMIGFDALGLI